MAVLAAIVSPLLVSGLERAFGQAQPPGCIGNGAGASIIRTPSGSLDHGEQVCYTVRFSNLSGVDCDITNFDGDLVLPDGTSIPMLRDVDIPNGTEIICPGNPLCETASNCTLPGDVPGYQYFVSHDDEITSFVGCPPQPTGDSGLVVAHASGLGDSLTDPPGTAAPCAAGPAPIDHGACCDPCSGECVDEVTANECISPRIFTLGGTCETVVCTPLVCPGPVPPCEGGQLCNPATGLCEDEPDAPLSTPCELDDNLCTPDHCDGNGSCVPNGPPVSCPGPIPPCEGGQLCNPATGLCEDEPDAPLSTPCETDDDLCTPEHCDGNGACAPNGPPVTCDPAIPPCEGGEVCNPETGLCEDAPDAPLSTPCTTCPGVSDECIDCHCDGSGACVDLPIEPCCGNGIVETGETCDPPGSTTQPNGNPCRDDCTFCGDGIVNGGEECDDGNDINDDECQNDCTPPETEETCRTPGFWGTHACGTNGVDCEKPNSNNLTQAALNACGGCAEICGDIIDTTILNDSDSALEAICVAVSGSPVRQLARHLTAAALNCCISGSDASCDNISVNAVFDACNTACAAGEVTAMVGMTSVNCIGAIDCFNNGGIYHNDTDFCQEGTCANGDPCGGRVGCADGSICTPLSNTCHDRHVGTCDNGAICTDQVPCASGPCRGPGPAGSSKACNSAIGNRCYVVGTTDCAGADDSNAAQSCP